MRFSLAVFTVAALASATLVARQADFPSCATPCILGGNVPTSDYPATDNACLYKNPDFIAATTKCVTTSCQGDDLRAALDFTRKFCIAVAATQAGLEASTAVGVSAVLTTFSASIFTSSAFSRTTTSGTSTTATTPVATPITPITANINDNRSKTPVGAIAGGAVGGFIFLFIVVILLYLQRRRRREQASAMNPNPFLLQARTEDGTQPNKSHGQKTSGVARRPERPRNYSAEVALLSTMDRLEELAEDVNRLMAERGASTPRLMVVTARDREMMNFQPVMVNAEEQMLTSVPLPLYEP